MISPKYIALAIEKGTTDDERLALTRLEVLAAELAALERDFPDRIAAAKAARNEAPVAMRANLDRFGSGAPSA